MNLGAAAGKTCSFSLIFVYFVQKPVKDGILNLLKMSPLNIKIAPRPIFPFKYEQFCLNSRRKIEIWNEVFIAMTERGIWIIFMCTADRYLQIRSTLLCLYVYYLWLADSKLLHLFGLYHILEGHECNTQLLYLK